MKNYLLSQQGSFPLWKFLFLPFFFWESGGTVQKKHKSCNQFDTHWHTNVFLFIRFTSQRCTTANARPSRWFELLKLHKLSRCHIITSSHIVIIASAAPAWLHEACRDGPDAVCSTDPLEKTTTTTTTTDPLDGGSAIASTMLKRDIHKATRKQQQSTYGESKLCGTDHIRKIIFN